MKIPSLEQLMKYRIHIAILAILISVVAWATELADLVYVCPFCRAQRTVIGLLGLFLLMNPQHWLNRWIASTFAIFGFVVGATQHFRGWAKIMSGKFEWGDQWYINSWLLSGFAIFMITALILYLWAWRPQSDAE